MLENTFVCIEFFTEEKDASMFSMKQFLTRAKKYFTENPGTLFVMVSQILLMVCAGLLIRGNSTWVEGLAVVAYFCLAIGVVLQLISQTVFHWIHTRIYERAKKENA